MRHKGETRGRRQRQGISRTGETRAQGERRDENDGGDGAAEKGVADCVAHRGSKRVSRGRVRSLVGRRDSCTMPEIPGGLRFRALFQTLRLPHGDFSPSFPRSFLLLLLTSRFLRANIKVHARNRASREPFAHVRVRNTFPRRLITPCSIYVT